MNIWLFYSAIFTALSCCLSLAWQQWRHFRYMQLRREFYAIWTLLSPAEQRAACGRAYGLSTTYHFTVEQCADLMAVALDIAWELRQRTGSFDINSLRSEAFALLPDDLDLAS